MSVPRTVSEVFNVKTWHDLKTGGRGHSSTTENGTVRYTCIIYDFLLVNQYKYSSMLYYFKLFNVE